MAERVAIITFDVPSSVGRHELRDFIVGALETWGGQRHPDDHLFRSLGNVKVSFLSVKPVKEKKARKS
jgi:hypothetical protein